MNEVTKEIPYDKLLELKKLIHKALSPKVKFNEDIDKMKKERDQEREDALYSILAEITRYL